MAVSRNSVAAKFKDVSKSAGIKSQGANLFWRVVLILLFKRHLGLTGRRLPTEK